ncbi:hypothetical protein J4E93_007754 [Alternaria ventricosa]|uniref:uncharacterized protein n=1 Tax=Alternaria ventricosa TaxID=1187951 RepID=UPI0020C34FBC|nr:uncharacterized protein J4E93_007754 [Alternaria ventricosa]KAI4641656.1 hypothetical protein J4E93_007754 [Alternaria ventricosa]
MSFGFAVGDVIAVGKLIKDITDCLRSAGGAISDYQELIKELDALKTALDSVNQLYSNVTPSALLDTIKSCRERLDEFWAKIKPYEPSLGSSSRSSAVRGTKDKLRWTFCRKEEVDQLQRNLQFYSSVIKMHLIRHVAGQVQDMRKNTDAVCTHIAERIHDTHDTLTDIGDYVSSQGAVASNIQTLVTGLHQFIFGEVRSFLADFGQLVSKVFSKCDVWFDHGTKTRNEPERRTGDVEELSSSMASSTFNDPVRSDRGVSDMEDRRSCSDYGKTKLFKNVKIAHLDQGSSSASDPKLDELSYDEKYYSDEEFDKDALYCDRQGCTASFTGTYRKGNLVRHKRQRHDIGGVIPYECEDLTCDKVFKRQDARLKHYRKYHPHLAAAPPRKKKKRDLSAFKVKVEPWLGDSGKARLSN